MQKKNRNARQQGIYIIIKKNKIKSTNYTSEHTEFSLSFLYIKRGYVKKVIMQRCFGYISGTRTNTLRQENVSDWPIKNFQMILVLRIVLYTVHVDQEFLQIQFFCLVSQSATRFVLFFVLLYVYVYVKVKTEDVSIIFFSLLYFKSFYVD